MTAYYILTHTVTDTERYRNEYIPGTWPILTKHQGEIVAVSLQAEVLHGDPPQGIIIVRFPSADVVREFVNDPEYAPLKQIRLQTTTDSSAVMVPGFTMPGT
ncbi:MAG: DUF1330 domain-containing protein [Candidatus Promineifilaceae bacterium]|nr:DUF1330 domain-containing protein [Candidatus Promineifilaceae bacterium]